jgi:hypothetical protein
MKEKIDLSALFKSDEDAKKELISLKKYAKNIKVFEAPIGSVEISASRETLSYGRNEPTPYQNCFQTFVGGL